MLTPPPWPVSYSQTPHNTKENMIPITPDTTLISEWSQERILADIEGMIRREGHRQYSTLLPEGVYMAQLCGVVAHLVRRSGMTRLITHDMDIVMDASGAVTTVTYAKGTYQLLQAHHRNLCAYRRAMFGTLMPTPTPAPTTTPAPAEAA